MSQDHVPYFPVVSESLIITLHYIAFGRGFLTKATYNRGHNHSQHHSWKQSAQEIYRTTSADATSFFESTLPQG